ncbi:aspartic peptidase domain-containing protein [Astrocystis sublimbata]|nr:aspartic peptidase domain-containing protein [Astrocystis sublimbata]
MSRRQPFEVIIATLLLAPSLARAAGPSALWLEPSSKWHGIDGNWSTTTLFVGEPAQEIDVVVSTSISELWVVENGGCGSPLCNDARGGVFNSSASTSWTPMGAWQLGSNATGIQANGDYAMETVVVYDSVRRWQTSLNQLIVAGINDTSAYIGLLGVGITEGNFGGVVKKSPIASLVEQSGIIPSHSYGYTPGAHYAGAKGMPMSLTLGGYDANRFEPHDVQFSLNATTRQPQVLVRSITASVSDVEKAPTEWSAPSITLSSFNESMTALVDSSTPYLWLPPTICDRFADAFNLTWNETLGLYIFPNNDDLARYRAAPDLAFTFTMSSSDDKSNFGSPTNMSGVVNITVSANAFVQSLQYPFKGVIEYGAPAVPYFPLKRAENDSQLIIGRSFLQEAYLITNYETSKFSIHKARFPDDLLNNRSIHTIAASPNSPYPGPPVVKQESHNINQSQIAGLVVGLCLGAIGLATTVLLVRRKRRAFKNEEDQQEMDRYKKEYSTTEPDSPMSPVAMTLFRMRTQAKRNGPVQVGKMEEPVEAHEVGADWGHARYEMPATLPVELDATDTTTRAYFAVPAGEDTPGKDSYKLPQQWAQPPQVPEQVESLKPTPNYNNKAAHLPPPINTQYRDSPSPTSSPTQDYDMNRMPSPMTPQSDSSTYYGDHPSPMAGFFPARTLSKSTITNPTMVCTPPSPTGVNDAGLVRAVSSVASIRSQTTNSVPTQPPIQRTPIDTTEVVCLGPLPDNIRFPHQLMMQRPSGPQGPDHGLPTMPTIPSENASRRHSTADTLGSNFTLEEEEARVAEVQFDAPAPDTQLANTQTTTNTQAATTQASDNQAVGRIDGFDIIHVPQMAHRRYSWEE